ncbi:hypothetical protein [Chryseobacterium gossypii]|uniref:hypothetical protein n=1 Tax=Chryseobacterium gossypii TaxID=3231602 RepID=UPI0035267AD7
MKKIPLLIFTICSLFAFGQKVSDFKYVFIPEKFQTFKDSFGLEQVLAKALKGKKYTVLSGNRDQWPAEAIENPCRVLNADVLNDKSLLRNKVILQFKDCNNKMILQSKGTSIIKEYEEGFPDALHQALAVVNVSNPTSDVPVQSAVPVNTNVASENATSAVSEHAANKYSNGKATFQKIQIDSEKFILADSNSSVPYATFSATTKKDVFRVKLQNGDSTIGYFENGNIIIEIPQSAGKYSKETFSPQ